LLLLFYLLDQNCVHYTSSQSYYSSSCVLPDVTEAHDNTNSQDHTAVAAAAATAAAGVVVVRECSLLPQSLSQHVTACTALSSGMGEEHFEIHSFHETVSAAATYCTCQ
jgi:hypothetical protein